MSDNEKTMLDAYEPRAEGEAMTTPLTTRFFCYLCAYEEREEGEYVVEASPKQAAICYARRAHGRFLTIPSYRITVTVNPDSLSAYNRCFIVDVEAQPVFVARET